MLLLLLGENLIPELYFAFLEGTEVGGACNISIELMKYNGFHVVRCVKLGDFHYFIISRYHHSTSQKDPKCFLPDNMLLLKLVRFYLRRILTFTCNGGFFIVLFLLVL